MEMIMSKMLYIREVLVIALCGSSGIGDIIWEAQLFNVAFLFFRVRVRLPGAKKTEGNDIQARAGDAHLLHLAHTAE
jgi:hypothetical protein